MNANHLIVMRGVTPFAVLAFTPLWAFAQAQSASASTAAPSEVNRERAKQLAEEGRRAYEEGRFERAEALIRGAYALDESPILVYNLGRILDAKGEARDARRTYIRYLELDPDTRARGRIERRIEVLDALIAKEDLRSTPPPPLPSAVQPATSSPETSRTVAPWVVVGTGAAVLGAGAVVGFLAQNKVDQARGERLQIAAEEHLSSGRTMATVANVLYVAGGALAAGGVVWALWAPQPESASVNALVAPGSILLSGRF